MEYTKKIKEKDAELIKINAQQLIDQVSFSGASTFLYNYVIRGPELILSFIPIPSDNSFIFYLFPYY